VHCIESSGRAAIVGLALLMAGCSSSGGRGSVVAPLASRPVVVPERQGAVQAKASTAPPAVALPAPRAMRNWDDVRLQAAQRIVSANPNGTYMGEVPEALLAIPVLEIELNGDGSVRRILVLRPPRQAHDTIQIAADAVRRAAPFGDVSRLPRPWKFVETFLFDDDRRFKPRTLD
jgi:hypothetical protein